MTSEDDQDQPTIHGDDIPEEEASQQEIIPFLGDELATALTSGGIVSISLPGSLSGPRFNSSIAIAAHQTNMTM